MRFETIVALATPPMKSALAIIRVSGDDAFDIVSKCSNKDIRKIDQRTLLIASIVDNEKVVDEVVLAIYKGPKSFTGEDLVEIICHGSVLIANEIIELLISKGARLATNGEYSSRAFLNQKIDLIQAEAINDVINATTKEAKALSIWSLKGETSSFQINASPLIRECVVLGYRDAEEAVGEHVGVIVVPDEDALAAREASEKRKFSESEIAALLRKEVKNQCHALADYKHPRRIQIRWEEFNKTSTGKIKRYLYNMATEDA